MKLVIGPDAALWLAERRARVPAHHALLAPTLLRSQVLAACYAEVRAGRLTTREADARLNHLRGLRVRLLGDRVLQQTAWKMAEALGWPDTFVAEYLALTRLQAQALVTRDAGIAAAASTFVHVVAPETLLS